MHDGTVRLIDLDASVEMGAKLDGKCSTAYASPESMVKLADGTVTPRVSKHARTARDVLQASKRGTVVRNKPLPDGEYELLDAHPSYDLWSYGCIIVRALTCRSMINVRRARVRRDACARVPRNTYVEVPRNTCVGSSSKHICGSSSKLPNHKQRTAQTDPT